MNRPGAVGMVAVAVSIAMLGCGATPPAGEPATERPVPVQPRKPDPAPVKPRPEPPTYDEPEPVASPRAEPSVPEPDAEGQLRVGGRAVEAYKDVREPQTDDARVEVTSWVRVVGAPQGADRIGIESSFAFCDVVELSVEPVEGGDAPLVLVQTFCELGEDVFTRQIHAAVVHVGDRSGAPRLLWEGEGTYRNSFGVCEHVDVPVAEVASAGVLVVEQQREVVAHDNPEGLGGEPCVARKARRSGKVEIRF